MYFLLLILWIILNGQFTLEILLFGLVVAALLYLFLCLFMGYSVKKDLFLLKHIFPILRYGFVLIKEIVKANVATIRLIFNSKEEAEPALVTFKAPLRTPTARAFLANAITLTPGTITVSVEKDQYMVHCLDQTMTEGLEDSVFVKMLARMEQGADHGTGV